MTLRYLSIGEVAHHTGLALNTLKTYSQIPGRMPGPDVIVGRTKGWLPGTIDKWMEARRK